MSSKLKFSALNGAKSASPAKLVLSGVFEGSDEGRGSAAVAFASSGVTAQAAFLEFEGQQGKTMLSFPSGGSALQPGAPVLYFGLGKREKFNLNTLRESLTAAFKAARKHKVTSVSVSLPSLEGTGVIPQELGEAVAVYGMLVDYEINHFKTEKAGHKPQPHFESVQVVLDDETHGRVKSGLQAGHIIGSAVNNARNLVNLPPSMCTPKHLADEARALAKRMNGAVTVKVLGRRECKKLNMGAFLAVSRGSDKEPQFIELTYEPANAVPGVVLGIVGKSVTFDAGGLDIKSAAGMVDMKCDMAGGAATLSAFGAIAALKLPIKVKAFMACTENMLGPDAFKPGDVIVDTMAGLSIEVGNTDAEGRLTLVDALEYAKRAGCTHLIDLATLTGAVSASLADVAAGLFTNDSDWALEVKAAARGADERVWELPMDDAFKKANDSEMADVKNTGGSFGAGSTTAALFIKEFVGTKTPWVHLDIAGVAYRGRDLGADPKGGTGWGVRTLVNLARQLSERK